MSAHPQLKDLARREALSLATFRRYRTAAAAAGMAVDWEDERACDAALVALGKRRVSKFSTARAPGVPSPSTATAARFSAGPEMGIEAQIERARATAEEEYQRYQAELARGEESSAAVAEGCLDRWKKSLALVTSLVQSREKDAEHARVWVRRADCESIYSALANEVAQQLGALETQILQALASASSAIDREHAVRGIVAKVREHLRRADFLAAAS